ncbi:MAG: hypothetical protein DDT28_00325 [Dehalococcoidia bacterium]|nr:hypothetical protein [Chloroflexota bacterium]
MRDALIGEGSNHVDESVYLAELSQELPPQPLSPAKSFGRSSDIEIPHLGGNDTLRLENRGEVFQPRVRHLHHPDVRARPARRIGSHFRLAPSQRIEDRRLPALGKSEDAEFHLHFTVV